MCKCIVKFIYSVVLASFRCFSFVLYCVSTDTSVQLASALVCTVRVIYKIYILFLYIYANIYIKYILFANICNGKKSIWIVCLVALLHNILRLFQHHTLVYFKIFIIESLSKKPLSSLSVFCASNNNKHSLDYK